MHGQAPSPERPTSRLEQRAQIESYKRLESKLDDFFQAHLALKGKVEKLTAEIRRLRSQLGERDPNTATRSEIKELAKAIEELERKRVADKNLILKEMGNLGRAAPAPPRPKPIPAAPQKGFEHPVQAGETLSAIIASYNSELSALGVKKKITLNQVLKANSGLEPTRLRIGQMVFLPDPR